MYVGLNIKEESVSYVVTDNNYKVMDVRQNGRSIPLIGMRILPKCKDAKKRNDERRKRRTANRRKFRKGYLRKCLKSDVLAKDPHFYTRLDNSFFYQEDKPAEICGKNILFDDKDLNDKEYYKKYPTIHHLIKALIDDTAPHDARLVFLALNYLMAHRGNSYMDISLESVTKSKNIDIEGSWEDFVDSIERFLNISLSVSADSVLEIMASAKNTTNKKKDLISLFADLCTDKVATKQAEAITTLLAGGQTNMGQLLLNDDYKDIKISLKSIDLDDAATTHEDELGEYFGIVETAKTVYDLALLQNMLDGSNNIAEAKIKIYEQHQRELQQLKKLIRKYQKEGSKLYEEVFKISSPDVPNYPAYARARGDVTYNIPYQKFAKYIQKILENFEYTSSEDETLAEEIIEKLKEEKFLPTPAGRANRVIPYQMVYPMFNQIIENAMPYMPSLSVIDDTGLSCAERIKQMFLFFVPHYMGPLSEGDKSEFSWLVKNEGEKNTPIRPWNIDKVINKNATEVNFINNLIGSCTYLKGEKVLPKESLAYQKFMLLNILASIKFDGVSMSPEMLHMVYEELFVKQQKNVNAKKLVSFLVENDLFPENITVTGIDTKKAIPIKLTSYALFRDYLQNNVLTTEDAEDIIYHFTIFEANTERKKEWLQKNYPQLKEADITLLSKKKFTDWGKLSGALLNKIAVDDDGNSILNTMYNQALTLQEVLSSKYKTLKNIEEFNKLYYKNNPDKAHMDIIIDEMYLNKGKRRAIYSAQAIISDIVKVTGKKPEKVFLYCSSADMYNYRLVQKNRASAVREAIKKNQKLLNELESVPESRLNNDKIYLYFMQRGKCAYTNEDIDFGALVGESNSDKLYTIEHIYPKSKTMDNTINNKVLIVKGADSDKKDKYPVPKEIRTRMISVWTKWREDNLLTAEKYQRLIRNEPFKDEELASFISKYTQADTTVNRVMTRLLMNRFGKNTDVCKVNEEIITDLANKFEFNFCSGVSGAFHSKLAYLGIVAGNIIDVKFTKSPSRFIDENKDKRYTINIQSIIEKDIERNGKVAWNKDVSPFIVKKELARNKMVRTYMPINRYSGQNGGFYDTQPKKKGDGALTPFKNDSRLQDTTKYGGYAKKGLMGFAMVEAEDKRGNVGKYMLPIYLYDFKKSNLEGAVKIACAEFNIKNPRLLYNNLIKAGFTMNYDGIDLVVTGKTGKNFIYRPLIAAPYDEESREYADIVTRVYKKIRDYKPQKGSTQKTYVISKYDKIDRVRAKALFYTILTIMQTEPYNVVFNNIANYLDNISEEWDTYDDILQTSILTMLVRALNPDSTDKVELGLFKGPSVAYPSKQCNLSGHQIRIKNTSTIGTYTKYIDI